MTRFDSISSPSYSIGTRSDCALFNVVDLSNASKKINCKPDVLNPCQADYKITLLHSHSRAKYGEEVVDVEPNALIFCTPKAPIDWLPQDAHVRGMYCVFTADFMQPSRSGIVLDEFSIFKADAYPVFQLAGQENTKAQAIFQHMKEEMPSDYAYKCDLLRTYVLELIHLGQKLQPAPVVHPPHDASMRVTSLFMALLEGQFPLELPQQQVHQRTAKDYADQLAVHVNYLNRALKETTGRTTTDLISSRMAQEAQVLLKYSDWTIAQIPDSLGFTDIAHFSRFFKRQMAVAPGALRRQLLV